MKKAHFNKILFLTIFWELCFLFILFYKGVVTNYKPITAEAAPFTFQTLFPTILISIIGAMFTASFEVLIFSELFRKMPFRKSITV